MAPRLLSITPVELSVGPVILFQLLFLAKSLATLCRRVMDGSDAIRKTNMKAKESHSQGPESPSCSAPAESRRSCCFERDL
jgi:hypothetical protein